MKKLVLTSFLSILIATVAYSDTITHPDLKNAHDLAEQAIKQVEGAQQTEAKGGVNDGGHADQGYSTIPTGAKGIGRGRPIQRRSPKETNVIDVHPAQQCLDDGGEVGDNRYTRQCMCESAAFGRRFRVAQVACRSAVPNSKKLPRAANHASPPNRFTTFLAAR